MKKYFDPRDRSDADYQRDVDSGKIDAFRRSDVGGVYVPDSFGWKHYHQGC